METIRVPWLETTPKKICISLLRRLQIFRSICFWNRADNQQHLPGLWRWFHQQANAKSVNKPVVMAVVLKPLWQLWDCWCFFRQTLPMRLFYQKVICICQEYFSGIQVQKICAHSHRRSFLYPWHLCLWNEWCARLPVQGSWCWGIAKLLLLLLWPIRYCIRGNALGSGFFFHSHPSARATT